MSRVTIISDTIYMQITEKFRDNAREKLSKLYGSESESVLAGLELLITKYFAVNGKYRKIRQPYSHKDVFLITYGDSVKKDGEYPLETLHRFVDEQLVDLINGVHILPFFPYSSDDGFSVVDYRKVREDLGDWEHVEKLSEDYKVMADLVINHISSKSKWFSCFLKGKEPWSGYFHTLDENENVSMVTRPRNTPLLTPVQTASGVKHVWTTFSPDQVDVNFSNPDVLLEYLDILFFYLSKGVTVIRLDAVAFLWKKTGTPSIHLEETHEVIRLIRQVAELVAPESVIITETNVPHKENISYFGDGDEAHMVYNFSLPPLLLHAILTENAAYLTKWSKKLTPPPDGCTYFNFTASHDGIGVRPLEGLVPRGEFDRVVDAVLERGGKVSYKQNPDGIESPYELNITFFDAFANPNDNNEEAQIKRFMCSQTLMLGFRGLPAIYIHSFTGTNNYYEGVRKTGINRTINRKKWDYDELERFLKDENSTTHKVLKIWRQILKARRAESAFDPQGAKRVLKSPREVFSMIRISPDEKSRILIAGNVSSGKMSWNTPVSWNDATDLITGNVIPDGNLLELEPWQVMWIKF